MKKVFTCCVLLVFAHTINAQSYFKENLFTTYLTNTIYSLVPTANNTVVLGADARVVQGQPEAYIGELSSSGSLLWNKTFQFKDDAGAIGAIKTTDNGYALVSSTGFIVKLKSDHSVQFINKIKFQYATGVNAKAFLQTADHGYIITGHEGSHPYDTYYHNMFLYKIDSNGNYQWSKVLLYRSKSYSIKQTKSGGYIIAGDSRYNYQDVGDMCVVKTDSLGNVIFSSTIANGAYSTGYDAMETADGGCLAVGEAAGTVGENNKAFIVKLSSSGAQQWTKTLSTNGNGYMRSWHILKDRHNTNTIASIIVDSSNTGYEHLINLSNDGTVNRKVTTPLDSGVSFTYVAACRGDDKSIWFATSAYGSGRAGFVITKSGRNGASCAVAAMPLTITENEGATTAVNQAASDYPGSVRDALSLVYGDGGTTIVTECVAADEANQIVNVIANQTLQLSNKLSVSPNPASSVIRINGLNAAVINQLSLTDITGKILASAKVSNSYYNWNIESLSKGFYFIRIQTNDKITTLKFIKQ